MLGPKRSTDDWNPRLMGELADALAPQLTPEEQRWVEERLNFHDAQITQAARLIDEPYEVVRAKYAEVFAFTMTNTDANGLVEIERVAAFMAPRFGFDERELAGEMETMVAQIEAGIDPLASFDVP